VLIDHLVYAVPDLAVVDRLGIPLVPGGRHVGLGTRNHLAGLGNGAYLEVIGPDPEQPEPDYPRPFGIDDLTEPKLVTWAVQVSDVDQAVERAQAQGYDPGTAVAMSRQRDDGLLLEWRLTPPVAGLLPFLIDWGATPHPAESLDDSVELVSFTAFHPDPAIIHKGLKALGAELTVEHGDQELRAVLRTPAGEVVLR
jgi:hypothetical protein